MGETFLGWKKLDSQEKTCLTAWRLGGRATHFKNFCVEEEDVFLCLSVSPQHLNEQNRLRERICLISILKQ